MGLYKTFHPAVLMYSALWGVFIYLWYEVLRLVRYLSANKRSVCVVCDVLFCLSFGIVLFMFSLAYNFGEVRIYMPVSMILVFTALRLTLGRWFFSPLFGLIRGIIGFTVKNLLKIKNIFAKLLKSAVFLVYNLVNKSVVRFSMKKGSR